MAKEYLNLTDYESEGRAFESSGSAKIPQKIGDRTMRRMGAVLCFAPAARSMGWPVATKVWRPVLWAVLRNFCPSPPSLLRGDTGAKLGGRA